MKKNPQNIRRIIESHDDSPQIVDILSDIESFAFDPVQVDEALAELNSDEIQFLYPSLRFDNPVEALRQLVFSRALIGRSEESARSYLILPVSDFIELHPSILKHSSYWLDPLDNEKYVQLERLLAQVTCRTGIGINTVPLMARSGPIEELFTDQESRAVSPKTYIAARSLDITLGAFTQRAQHIGWFESRYIVFEFTD